MADDNSSLFSAAGFDVPKKVAPDSTDTAPDKQDSDIGLFKAAGLTTPKKSDAQSTSRDTLPIPVPGTPAYDKATYNDPANADTLENRLLAIRNAIDPVNVARTVGGNWLQDTLASLKANNALAATGAGQIRSGMPATGIANVALGLGGDVFSPLTGAANTLIGRPVTALTGNPDIGDRFSALSTVFLPTKGAGAVVRGATETGATNALVNAIGPENVPEAVARLRANPRLSVMDVSDPVRTMAQGLIDPGQPTAQNILTKAVRDRQATAPAAVNSAYTAAMGPAPNVVNLVDALKARATAIGRNAIEPALGAAKPVDVSPVLAAIDKDLKPGMQAFVKSNLPLSPYQQELMRIRQSLTDEDSGETLTDAGRLHDIQAGLRAKAQNLLSSASGADRNLGGDLMGVRNSLVGAIDDAAGGAYAPALSKYRDAMQVQEAFDAGFDTLKNRSGVSGLEDRPESFAQWMKDATPEEIVARRLGTRADIDQKIRGVKNQALAGQNITAIEYNREKLGMLFGKDEADRLVQVMSDAQAEAQTNAKLLAGAKTAETLAGQRALEVPKVGGGNVLNWAGGPMAEIAGDYLFGSPGLGSALFLAGKGAQYGGQAFRRNMALRRNIEFAKAASAIGPERDAVINSLIAHPSVVRANSLVPTP